MTKEKFMASSMFLFLDIIVIAVSSWLYWIVISKIVSTSDVGLSSAIYSLVFLAGAIVGLGMEYPLLRNASWARNKIVGPALVVELIITAVAIPIVIYTIHELHHETPDSYIVIAVIMLISVSAAYIGRYSLLGISGSRTILVIDTISVVVKFVSGYFLVVFGFGSLGILISFLLQALLSACIALVLAYNKFRFGFGELKYIKDTFREGIVNMPSIFSRTLVVSLSVVLLASFGIASSEIGIFYIALMISVLAGGLISSAAYMVIPASTLANKDLSSGSIRIGLSLTAPIISALLVSPKFVLSLIGTEYVSGQLVLIILAMGILPFAIATNTISRLNYQGQSRRLVFIGSLQVIGFVVGFVLLVPHFNTLGAALSILLSYSVSCIPALVWSEKILIRYVFNTAVAVVIGWSISSLFKLLISNIAIAEPITVLSCIVITTIMIFALKNTSITEVRTLLQAIIKNTKQ